MDRAAWLRKRQSGVFSTDAAALAGVGFVGADQIYRDKVEEFPTDRVPTLRMKLGTELEPFVLREYAERTGLQVLRTPHESVRHPRDTWRGCSPDGFATSYGRCRLLEAKCVFAPPGGEWGEPGTDQIPDGYLVQVQHALDVCLEAGEVSETFADVAVLFVGYEFRVYRVQLCPSLLDPLVDLEREFWDLVQRREPVAADWKHPLRDVVTNRLAQIRPGAEIELGDDALEVARQWDEWKAQERDARQIADSLKCALTALLGTAESGRLPDGRIVRQKVVQRGAYTVEPTRYVDFRILNPKRKAVPSE